MEKLIPELYKSYGSYVNQKKMLPNSIDGTIPIQKRFLLGLYTIARTDFKKTPEIIGYVIGHWHPHSDAIQGTAEILVHNGFAIGRGNWGSRIGIENLSCAAPRYTSLKLSGDLVDIAFKYIKDVDWEEDELKPEPVYLPTMFPLCLMGKIEFNMIGFGFKTEIPVYDKKDLAKRLLYLLGQRRRITITPQIEGCDILSSQNDLEDLLSKKDRNLIKIRGKYTVDKNKFRVYINGWSPRSTFGHIFNSINSYKGWKLFDNGELTYIDESSDTNGTKIRIEVNKQRKKSDTFDKLLEAVENVLTTTIPYSIYVVNEKGTVELFSVDEYLLSSYNFYKKVVEKHYKRMKKESIELITEYKQIEKLKPHISTALGNGKDEDSIINKLSKLSGVSVDDIKSITDKYKIRKLITIDTDTKTLKSKIQDIDKVLNDVDGKVTEDYKSI